MWGNLRHLRILPSFIFRVPPKKKMLRNLNLELRCVDVVKSVSKAKLNRTCPQILTLCLTWSLKQAPVWMKDIKNNRTNLNAAFIELFWKLYIFLSFFFFLLCFCLQHGITWSVIFRSERSPSVCFSTLLRLTLPMCTCVASPQWMVPWFVVL